MKAPRYLLDVSGIRKLAKFVDVETLFAFDLDGTLAPIVDDPGKVRIPSEVIRGLEELKKWAYVAVITGRSCGDARLRLGFIPHHIIGNHGAEGVVGWEAKEREFQRMALNWERQLRKFLDGKSGIVLENKGMSITLHYRGARNISEVQTVLEEAISHLSPEPRRIGGKYVENLLPEEAPDKGEAFLQLMNAIGRSKGFFAGDDETDEDVFHLTGDNIFTVRVGKSFHSRAGYYLKSQREVASMLEIINNTFSGRMPE
ncbi:MAG TPA: trehalose-phosphatase [Syntrophales bacterium]|nr:trehalose-phosphatase [Syntrophales bacterium]HOL58235.1 trehalose-phosphatase [Syntrophales bacterium]HPO36298.1 trehalose-phosphatase [Syntrophales bacterium]